MTASFILVFLISYVLGTIPVAILAARWWAGVDPRQAGSHNVGFTNVLRVAGTIPGAITLLGDMGKGAAAVLMAHMVLGAGDWDLVAGGFAILGHVYPVFRQFRGGKGVATAMGVFLALDWVLGLSLIFVWLMSLALWRISSLAAIIAFGALPAIAWLSHTNQPGVLLFAVAVTALVVYRHTDNIRRLLGGTESKFGVR
jgi:glycerol-3-phosphate acyltransferase PlsY